MIQQQTILHVADNSGAKEVKCIKVSKGFKRRTATLGDVITISVKQLRNKARFTAKVSKGEIYKAVILRVKNKHSLLDGAKVWFNENSVCLINKQGKPIATRIIGPIPKILKKKNFLKLINISGGFI